MLRKLVRATPFLLFGIGTLLAVGSSACSSNGATAEPPAANGGDSSVCAQGSAEYRTGCNYLVTFYPLWFSDKQFKVLPANAFFGPETVDHKFEKVVAVNVDTLYTTTVVDVTTEPVIVTIPATTAVFSVLHLDQYGQAFAAIPSGAPGVYGLTPPGFQGALPAAVTNVPMPYARSIVILRADRYAATGEDTQEAATQFRRDLHIATLSAYSNNPSSGAASTIPVGFFSASFKLKADGLMTSDPTQFLTELQAAVQSTTNQPLTKGQQSLANAFDDAFARSSDVVAGASAGYAAILDNYQAHTVRGSRWISFDNIANWGDDFQGTLDRASITEYLQFGNLRQTAVYYHSFVDDVGQPLDGSAATYTLRFASGAQPEVGRFWSLTAYTPDTVELVKNGANKYAVASYTPELVTEADGSVSITMAATKPAEVPAANWLPAPSGRFNVMLRAYAPRGTVLNGSYVPPAVTRGPL